jgi:hypothetical protein
MVGVAQPVEHLVVVQDVAGSSPVTHPIFARPDLPHLVLGRGHARSAEAPSSLSTITAPSEQEVVRGVRHR